MPALELENARQASTTAGPACDLRCTALPSVPVGSLAHWVGSLDSCPRSLALQALQRLHQANSSHTHHQGPQLDVSLQLSGSGWEDEVERRLGHVFEASDAACRVPILNGVQPGLSAPDAADAPSQTKEGRARCTSSSTWFASVAHTLAQGQPCTGCYAKEVKLAGAPRMSLVHVPSLIPVGGPSLIPVDGPSVSSGGGPSITPVGGPSRISPAGGNKQQPGARLHGYADFVVLYWRGERPVMRVVECKASPAAQMSHQVQVVCYLMLLEAEWGEWVKDHPHLKDVKMSFECVLAIKGQQEEVDVTGDLSQSWPAMPTSKVASLRCDIANLLSGTARGALQAAAAEAQGQGVRDLESLPFHYGSHCSSCSVAGDCLARAHQGQGALELSGCTAEEARTLRAAHPAVTSLARLAAARASDLTTAPPVAAGRAVGVAAGVAAGRAGAPGLRLPQAQRLILQAHMRLSCTGAAALMPVGAPQTSGMATTTGHTPGRVDSGAPKGALHRPDASSSTSAAGHFGSGPVMELLPWAIRSSLPPHAADAGRGRAPLLQAFVFLMADPAVGRLLACGARVQCVGHKHALAAAQQAGHRTAAAAHHTAGEAQQGAPSGVMLPRTLVCHVSRPWRECLSPAAAATAQTQTAGTTTRLWSERPQHGDVDDDATEAEMLDAFCSGLRHGLRQALDSQGSAAAGVRVGALPAPGGLQHGQATSAEVAGVGAIPAAGGTRVGGLPAAGALQAGVGAGAQDGQGPEPGVGVGPQQDGKVPEAAVRALGLRVHLYFVSQRQARTLVARLHHLVGTTGRDDLSQHAAWVQGVLGQSAAFDGEQPLVSYLEEQAGRFAWRCHSRDLHTLSQHPWDALASLDWNSKTDGVVAVNGWEAEHQLAGGYAAGAAGGMGDACSPTLTVAGCGASVSGSGAEQRIQTSTPSISPSWFWAHLKQQQLQPQAADLPSTVAATSSAQGLDLQAIEESSREESSRSAAIQPAAEVAPERITAAQQQLVSRHPDLLLHVLSKQVQAMSWVEKALQAALRRSNATMLPGIDTKQPLSGEQLLQIGSSDLPPVRAVAGDEGTPVMAWAGSSDLAVSPAAGGGTGASGMQQCVALLRAARDAVLLEHHTDRREWEDDVMSRKTAGDRATAYKSLAVSVTERPDPKRLHVRVEPVAGGPVADSHWAEWLKSGANVMVSFVDGTLDSPQQGALHARSRMFAEVKHVRQSDVELAIGGGFRSRNPFLVKSWWTFEAFQAGNVALLEDAPDISAWVTQTVTEELTAAVRNMQDPSQLLQAPSQLLQLLYFQQHPRGRLPSDAEGEAEPEADEGSGSMPWLLQPAAPPAAAALHSGPQPTTALPAAAASQVPSVLSEPEREHLRTVLARLELDSVTPAAAAVPATPAAAATPATPATAASPATPAAAAAPASRPATTTPATVGMRLRAEQCRVVRTSCEGMHRLHLMQGPPGTGKTETLAALVLARAAALSQATTATATSGSSATSATSAVRGSSANSAASGSSATSATSPANATSAGAITPSRPFVILLSANTNSAVKVLLDRIHQRAGHFFPGFARGSAGPLAIIYAASAMMLEPGDETNVAGSACTVVTPSKKKTSTPEQLGIRAGQVCVLGGTVRQLSKAVKCAQLRTSACLTYLVVDEGTQMPAAHMVALASMLDQQRGCLMVAGDHRQLQNITKHDWANEFRASLSCPAHLSAYGYLEALHAHAPDRVAVDKLAFSLRLPPPLCKLLAPLYKLDGLDLMGFSAAEWVAANTPAGGQQGENSGNLMAVFNAVAVDSAAVGGQVDAAVDADVGISGAVGGSGAVGTSRGGARGSALEQLVGQLAAVRLASGGTHLAAPAAAVAGAVQQLADQQTAACLEAPAGGSQLTDRTASLAIHQPRFSHVTGQLVGGVAAVATGASRLLHSGAERDGQLLGASAVAVTAEARALQSPPHHRHFQDPHIMPNNVAALERAFALSAVPPYAAPPDWSSAWKGPFGVVLVSHDECASSSTNPLEQAIVEALLRCKPQQVGSAPLTQKECVILSPHRAQCAALKQRLAADPSLDDKAQLVSTVDKMQGDEASTVIYSETASDPGTLAANADFYTSIHRANVAFSRAKGRLIVVAPTSLLNALPRTLTHHDNLLLWKGLRDSMDKVLSQGMVGGHQVTISSSQDYPHCVC